MIIDESLAKQIIQPRPLDSHKGTFGRALLIGGNYPYGVPSLWLPLLVSIAELVW